MAYTLLVLSTFSFVRVLWVWFVFRAEAVALHTGLVTFHQPTVKGMLTNAFA